MRHTHKQTVALLLEKLGAGRRGGDVTQHVPSGDGMGRERGVFFFVEVYYKRAWDRLALYCWLCKWGLERRGEGVVMDELVDIFIYLFGSRWVCRHVGMYVCISTILGTLMERTDHQ